MEWHNLCDKCGDLQVSTTKPAPYAQRYCTSCGTTFPDGFEGEWYPWNNTNGIDWAGCA